MIDLTSLTYEEKVDLGLVYGGALLIGLGSIVLRVQSGRPTGGFDQSVFKLQYALAFMFLGAIVLLRARVRTPGGAFLTTGLAVALAVGLFLPVPGVELIDIVSFALLGVLVFFGGVLHYRLNRPTNAQVIALTGLFIAEFYLYGVGYSVAAFLQVGNPFFLVGVLVMTIIMYGTVRILFREYSNSYSTVLNPVLETINFSG